MPVIKLAVEGQFDLRCPRYDDPTWWVALQLSIDNTTRGLANELAKTNMSSAIAHSLLMVVQSVLFPDDTRRTFDAKRKVVLSMLDSAVTISHESLTGKPSDDLKKSNKKKEESAGDQAAAMWENVFGKRGDVKVEAAISQTERILQGMIAEGEAARAASKRKGRKTRRA